MGQRGAFTAFEHAPSAEGACRDDGDEILVGRPQSVGQPGELDVRDASNGLVTRDEHQSPVKGIFILKA